ncbi:MAG: phytanoyl-CoA dioxygenase family protein [Proteobacteria bacterium]|nr:phytanoyl-CoA dioxygenase family protein [Pseudomonadota bacterium]
MRVPQAFSPQWLDAFTAALDGLIADIRAGRREAQSASRESSGAGTAKVPVCEDHDGYLRLLNVLACEPRLRQLVLTSPAPEIVAALTGTRSLRLWMDGTFLKEGQAAGTATPWHNDECTYSLVGEQCPSLWIALTDVEADNSPLTTLDGSNKDRYRYHSPFSPQDVERPSDYRPWSELQARVAAADAPISTWPAKRGDAVLLHPKTIHGALPRTAERAGRRLGFSVRWMGDDVVWRPNVLTRLSHDDNGHPEFQEGAPPPESVFPIVWRGTPT